jgi:hypothetical protein
MKERDLNFIKNSFIFSLVPTPIANIISLTINNFYYLDKNNLNTTTTTTTTTDTNTTTTNNNSDNNTNDNSVNDNKNNHMNSVSNENEKMNLKKHHLIEEMIAIYFSFLTSKIIQFAIGLTFIVIISTFIQFLRTFLHERIFFFVRNPDDPNFNYLKELIQKPLWKHLKGILFTLLLLGTLVLALIRTPLKFSKYFLLDSFTNVNTSFPIHHFNNTTIGSSSSSSSSSGSSGNIDFYSFIETIILNLFPICISSPISERSSMIELTVDAVLPILILNYQQYYFITNMVQVKKWIKKWFRIIGAYYLGLGAYFFDLSNLIYNNMRINNNNNNNNNNNSHHYYYYDSDENNENLNQLRNSAHTLAANHNEVNNNDELNNNNNEENFSIYPNFFYLRIIIFLFYHGLF